MATVVVFDILVTLEISGTLNINGRTITKKHKRSLISALQKEQCLLDNLCHRLQGKHLNLYGFVSFLLMHFSAQHAIVNTILFLVSQRYD